MAVGDRVDTLRGYLAHDPGNVPLACDLFDELVSQGMYADAEALLALLPEEAGLSSRIQFRAARLALIMGRYEDAQVTLLGLIEGGTDHTAIWHDLAFCQLCQRSTGQARASVSRAIEEFGPSIELSILRARIEMMDGEFEQAQACLLEVLSSEPGNALARGLMALAVLDAGDPDGAFEVARASLAIDPDQHEALLVAGTAALWRQQLDPAEGFLVRALNRHPNSGRALSGLGQARMLRNDLAGARNHLERATRAMPDHIGTWHALAWTQLLQSDVPAAEVSFRSAYDLDRNFADSHGGLALVDALKGNTAEAELAIRRALRLSPQCQTALYAQTVLLSDAGRTDEADALLGAIVAQSPLPGGLTVREFAQALRSRFATAT